MKTVSARGLTRFIKQFCLGLRHELAHVFADLVFGVVRSLGLQITFDLAIDIFVPGFLKVSGNDFLGIGHGRFGIGDSHFARRPQTQQFVASGLCLELHLGIMGKLAFKALLAIFE